MPDDPIWPYPIQRNISGAGLAGSRPGQFTSDPGATVGWLWEEPADIAQGHVIVRLILGNPNASTAPWAGANVYLSYDDLSYALLAQTSQRSIIGELDTALPLGAGTWQPAATCDIDITASPGTLVTTDAAGCQAGVNLCLIGDEICSFVDATPIAGGYRLTGFQRGWYGTTVALHAIGTRFAMLSPLQARVDLPISAKGQTWHVKLASLNIGRVEMAMGAAVHLTFDGKGLGATLLNTGLHLLDIDASHDLIIAPGSNLTADRIFTITTGNADRLFSILADLYVEALSRVNQDLTTDANVNFGSVTCTAGASLNYDLEFRGPQNVRDNVYYSGGWKYYANGAAWMALLGASGLDWYVAANNAGGPGAALTPLLVMSWKNTSPPSIVVGGDIGISADTDLIGLAANALTVRGDLWPGTDSAFNLGKPGPGQLLWANVYAVNVGATTLFSGAAITLTGLGQFGTLRVNTAPGAAGASVRTLKGSNTNANDHWGLINYNGTDYYVPLWTAA
jgi:hypothetical protein